MTEHSVKYVPPAGFFGIHIFKNSISARAPPQTTLGDYEAPQIPYSTGSGYHFPILPHPFGV